MKSNFVHSFIVDKNLTKAIIIFINMQQFYRTGSDWTPDGHMYLHYSSSLLISSPDITFHGSR